MLNGDAQNSLEVEQAYASDPLPSRFQRRNRAKGYHMGIYVRD
jgi:hypothetical protein